MSALGIRMRRLRASLMLVAALAFAFHGGVVAATGFDVSAQASVTALHHGGDQGLHGLGLHELGSHDHDRHAHGAGDHGAVQAASGAAAHAAAAQADGGHGDHDHGKGHCKTNCCGAACTVAVLAMATATISRAEVSSVLVAVFEPVLSGVDPNGIRRPPRPPSIA